MNYFFNTYYIKIYSFNKEILKYKNDFQLLNLNERNIGELYKQFQKIDINNDNYIQYFELLKYLELESTKFILHIFDIYDVEKSGIFILFFILFSWIFIFILFNFLGMVYFKDFVFITWNICTIEKLSLERFVFDLYDVEDVGALDIRDLFAMMKDIYGRDFNKNYQIQK